jgi:transmembrane sensor
VSGNYRLDNIEGAIRTLADASGVEMTRIPGGFIILR